jgi:Putative prokaryotic signal transducing protein
MATIDPEQERRRLAEFYAYQMDGELEKVASQADDLTDMAREALHAEMARRGLATALAAHAGIVSPQDEGDEHGMVTIRQFRDLPEALFAKGSLESAGIECALIDDNMVRLDWFISNLLGGVKLQVKAEDAAVAEEILSQPIPENFDVTGVGQYEQPRCPKCQSLDVNFQEVAPAAYLSAAISVPFPFHRRAWRCHSCDAEWEDDGVDAAETNPHI